MAQALLATGAGKGTRIGLLAPDGALLLTTFYAALRIGALVTPDQHADDAARAGAHPPDERRADPHRRAPVPAPRLRGEPRRRRCPVWPTPARRRCGCRARRTSAPSGSTMPTASRGPARSTSSSARADGAGRARRRAARRGRAGGVAGRRRVRRLHLGQHCRPRRRSSTASGRSRRQPRALAPIFLMTGERPDDAAAAGVLAGRHRRRAPGAVHRQHARLPAVARRSTTSSTRSSATTSPTSSSGTRWRSSAPRRRRGASTSTASAASDRHPATSTASASPAAAPGEPARDVGELLRAQRRADQPAHARGQGRRVRSSGATASNVASSTRRPARRCRRARSASSSSAAAR